jgi:hypothetical protein
VNDAGQFCTPLTSSTQEKFTSTGVLFQPAEVGAGKSVGMMVGPSESSIIEYVTAITELGVQSAANAIAFSVKDEDTAMGAL